jgi:hypothetical protein
LPSREAGPRLIRLHLTQSNKIREKFRMILPCSAGSGPSTLQKTAVQASTSSTSSTSLSCLPYMLLSLPKCHQHHLLLLILHRCRMHTLGPLHPLNLLSRKNHHPVQSENALTPQTTRQKTLRLNHGKAGMARRKRRPTGHAFIAKRHILLATTVCVINT